jgi:DnaK suppressor protein
MNKTELQKIKKQLQDRKSYLVKALSGDMGSLGGGVVSTSNEIGDAAQANDIEEMIASIAASESEELELINAALKRIANGTYGICEDCEKKIPSMRMKYVPSATRCIKCQEVWEDSV